MPTLNIEGDTLDRYGRYNAYSTHLKETHYEFYRWDTRWNLIQWLSLIPFLILIGVASNHQNVWLLLLSFAILAGSYFSVRQYRKTSVVEFKTRWQGQC